MPIYNPNVAHICQQFAAILGGTSEVSHGVCRVSNHRKLNATILGRPSSSTTNLEYAFESMDNNGQALCIAEVALLSEEVTPYISVLSKYNLTFTALHNHWLFDSPRIMYLHYFSVEDPVQFALKANEASKVLTHEQRNLQNHL